MKKMIGMVIGLALAALAVTATASTNVYPATEQERAFYGATHVLALDFNDLAGQTTTNRAFTNDVSVKAGSYVEFVTAKLFVPFDTGNTNYTGSVAVKVGDTTDDDYYLTSTEWASDGTEVFAALARQSGVTYVTTNLVTTIYDFYSNAVQVVTGQVSTAVGTTASYGSKYYSAAGTLRITLTPNSQEALSANTQGKASLYFRIR